MLKLGNKRRAFRMSLRLSLAQTCLWMMLLGLVVGIPTTALAQLDTGAIAGSVLDPAGKSIPGAKITLKGVDTGTLYSTVSAASGYYSLPAVRPGKYEVTVTDPGFKTVVDDSVVIAVGTTTAFNVNLAVGEANVTVNVVAGDSGLETESSEIDVDISPEQVDQLPLSVAGFRSPEALEYLAPGVAGFGQSSDGTDTIKVAGGQEMGTDFLLDGITTNREENGSGSFGIVNPSMDAVYEFHISIANVPISEGRTTGGLANFNTRGGTNSYHGAGYMFYKNAAFDALDWFQKGRAFQATGATRAEELAKPADTKEDYGANAGGPILIPHLYNGHNKSFFFFNFEQWHQAYGGPIESLLPTPAELGSDGQYYDFSSLLGSTPLGTSPCGETVYPGEIMDPQYDNTSVPCRYAGFGQTVTGGPGAYVVTGAPTNKIPIGRQSSIANLLVSKYLMPLAQQEVPGSSTYNYVYNGPGSRGAVDNTAYSLRVDQNLGENHKVWAFLQFRENTDTGGNSNLPLPIQTCCGTVDQRGSYLRAGWDWTLSPNLVNVLTVGGNRSNNINKAKASKTGTDWDSTFGIANGFSDDFPVFQFIGNTFGGIGQQEDSTDVDNTVALNDVLHWQRGAHNFTLGGEGQYHQYSWVSSIGGTCSGNAGCFQFWDNQTASDEDYWGQDGNSLAAFLIGETGLATNLADLHAPRWISHYGALFAGDNWKASPHLNINFGVRWSYETPRHEADGDTSIWDPNKIDEATDAGTYPQAKGALVFAGKGAGRNGSVNETWGSVYRKDFAPRVGFAWQPPMFNGKAVLRGSAGMYYGPLVYADYGQGTAQGFTVQGSLFTNDPLDGVPLDSGLQAMPTTPNLNPNQLDGTSISADYVAPTNGRPGMVENWGLEAQYELSPHTTLIVGYMGNHADKDMALGDWLNWWAAAPGPLGWSGPPMEPYANFTCQAGPPTCTWAWGVSEAQALRPFPQIEYINMDSYLQNLGQSTYEALEARLDKRFSNGLSILASYTFSKTLTDADVVQPYWSTLQNGGAVQDPENLRAEKCVSSEDTPNNLAVSYIYELPVGKGRKLLSHASRPVNMLVANWNYSGILHYESGQPMSIYGATGIPGKNSSVRFDRVAGQPVKNSTFKNPLDFDSTSYASACNTGYFNCNAFYDPNLFANRDPNGVGASGEGNPWQFGTMPRNSADIRWIPWKSEDMGLVKTFPVREGMDVQFNADMFNVFNRHYWDRPNSGMGVGGLADGQIGGDMAGGRTSQFRLRVNF
ncbi:MAG: carboxypeptidase-like regulatory domain-containing protein [Terracidiphilus sp.]